MARKTFTLTLEPVAACNLDCAYCYAHRETAPPPDAARFVAALDQVVRYAAAHGCDGLDCVWLGGEPLLAGIDFFTRMVAWTASAASRIDVRHFLQTNGMALDGAWCRLLREADVRLGLSLDGPRDIHDAFRRGPGGAPTFARVMDALGMLRHYGVPFGCVAVVTRQTLGRERDVYDFFCGLGCGFRINPVIPGPEGTDRAARITPEEYGGSLVRYFDAWNVARPDRVNVSPLDNYAVSLLGGALQECQQRDSCARLSLGIKPNGDVVRCGRFQDRVLGNLADTTVEALLAGGKDDAFDGRADALASCHACVWWKQCHGGCPHNAVAFGRDIRDKDPFCAAYKMIFSHIASALSL